MRKRWMQTHVGDIMFELKAASSTSGFITKDDVDTGAFLQDKEFLDLQDEIEKIDKLLRWKKIGKQTALQMQDDLLEQYVPNP